MRDARVGQGETFPHLFQTALSGPAGATAEAHGIGSTLFFTAHGDVAAAIIHADALALTQATASRTVGAAPRPLGALWRARPARIGILSGRVRAHGRLTTVVVAKGIPAARGEAVGAVHAKQVAPLAPELTSGDVATPFPADAVTAVDLARLEGSFAGLDRREGVGHWHHGQHGQEHE